jgi:cell division protein ZapA (FtsZ GTPase activity inhibitor)
MAETSSAEASSSSSVAPVFKKRSSRPKGGGVQRSLVRETEAREAGPTRGNADGDDDGDDDAESAVEQGYVDVTIRMPSSARSLGDSTLPVLCLSLTMSSPTLEDLISIRALRTKPIGIELNRLNKGETRKKKKKKPEKTSKETEEERWAEQMQKGGLVTRNTPKEATSKNEVIDDDEDEDDDDDEDDNQKSKNSAPRLVKQDNFQGETGTVDVDKHMMAYIEEEMQKRRQRGELTKEDGSIVTTDQVKAAGLNPQDELFSIAEKYRKIQQSAQETLDAAKRNVNKGHIERREKEEKEEEGNATFSQAMLTGVPEIDLGIDLRMKNIQDTEKARRAMMEAQKEKSKEVPGESEGDFASARCECTGTMLASASEC